MATAPTAQAAPGDLVTSFGEGGVVNYLLGSQVRAVTTQGDGRIVAAIGGPGAAVDRLSFVTGNFDTTFAGDGRRELSFPNGTHPALKDVVVQPDGKILVVGSSDSDSNGSDELLVWRLNADGTDDASFGTNGRVTTTFGATAVTGDAIALQPDGRIVVAGTTHTVGPFGFTFDYVARLLTNGQPDASFGSNGVSGLGQATDGISDLAVTADGKIVHVGTKLLLTNDEMFSAKRLLSNGDIDPGFAEGDITRAGRARAVVVQPDGKIVAAGETNGATEGNYRRFALYRWNTDGTADTTFDTGALNQFFLGGDEGSAADLVRQANGRLVLVGTRLEEDGDEHIQVIRTETDGTPDGSFGQGGSLLVPNPLGTDAGTAVTINVDGDVVAGGYGEGAMLATLRGDPLYNVAPQGPTKVVYYSDQDGDYDIYVTDGTLGGAAQRLTTNSYFDAAPSISRDGTRIAWRADAFGEPGVWVMNSDGSGARNVANVESSVEDHPAWDPTGNRLAYISGADGDFEIYTLHTRGGAPVRITNNGVLDARPTWSPDGTKIAFYRGSFTTANLVIANADGSGETLLTNANAGDVEPTWSPNSNKIAFCSHRSGAHAIWTINADGTGLTNTGIAGCNPTFSPDGTRIAAGTDAGGNWDIVTAPSTGTPGGLPLTLVGGAGNQLGPSWTQNLKLTAAVATAPASPSALPTDDIPTQPTSPEVESAPVGILNIGSSPVGILNIGSSPVGILNIGSSPVGILNIGSSPVGILNIGSSPVGILNIGSSPLVQDGLKQIRLSQIPLKDGATWRTFLGPIFADRPLEDITLFDVLALSPTPPLPTWGQMDLSQSPLGQLSPLSLILGDTRLKQLSLDREGGWCKVLEDQGYANCGAALGIQGHADRGLTASLLSLQIAGVDLGQFPLGELTYGDLAGTPESTPLLGFPILSVDLFTSSIGSRLVRDLAADPAAPNDATRKAAVDCSNIDCTSPTLTLHQAQAHIRHEATFADLGTAIDDVTLTEVTLATMGVGASNPYEDASYEELGAIGYGGPTAGAVRYGVDFTPIAVGPAHNPRIEVVLPQDFTYAPGSARLSFFAPSGLSTIPTPIPDPTVDGQRIVFTPTVTSPGGTRLHVDFDARPGLTLGSYAAAVVVSGGGYNQGAGNQALLSTVENWETGDTLVGAPEIQSGQLVLGHIARVGDVDYFRLRVPNAGSRISVYLDHLEADFDLTLYHPATAAPAVPVRPVGTNLAPAAQPVEDHQGGANSKGEPVTPETLQDIPLANLPIAGLSANRGTESEEIQAVSWASADPFYVIGVTGYVGAVSANAYALRAEVTAPAALPVGDALRLPFDTNPSGFAGGAGDTPEVNPAPAVLPLQGTVKTVILTHRGRMEDTFGTTRAASTIDTLNRLAQSPSVQGLVVPVDAYASVRGAYAAWDARPSDPAAANAVVRAINTEVDALFGARRAEVKYLVIAGTDTVLPMTRVPDLTQNNERGFAQEIAYTAANSGGNNALLGALSTGHILTDDGYTAFTPKPWLGTWQYLPDVASGRLVETPEEMKAVVDQFVSPQSGDAHGVLRPAKSFTTGYEFMADMAQAIDASLEQTLGSAQGDLTSETWSRADLEAGFTEAQPVPDILSINAHYNPYAALPAGRRSGDDEPQAEFTTSKVLAGPDLAKRIFATIGCHSGFSIADYVTTDADPRNADWTQVVAAKGAAAFVGQTGYGLGLEHTTAYSEKVLTSFAANLRTMTLGNALVEAKQGYVGLQGVTGVNDYKVLAQATYYGLPMFRLPGVVGEGSAPAPVSAATPTAITVTDTTTGEAKSSVTLDLPTDGSVWQANNTADGTYYSIDKPGAALLATDDRPIQPSLGIDVTAAGRNARYGLLTELSSVDTPGVDPVLAHPVVNLAANEDELQFGDVIFPAALQGITSYRSLSGNRQQLVVVPAQFQSTGFAGGDVVGRQRRYTKVGVEVLYGPTSGPGVNDITPPTFQLIEAVTVGNVVSFRAKAVDVATNGGGVIDRIEVLFRDASGADWKRVALTQGADGVWTGGAAFVGTKVEYIASAVDANNNGATSTNKGDLFDSVVLPLQDPDAAIKAVISGTPAGTNGWYKTASVTMTGPEGVTFDTSVDGAAFSAYTAPVAITGDGVHILRWRASTGDTGSVGVAIDTAAPVITVRTPAAGIPSYLLNSAVFADYECNDQAGVASCVGTVADGARIDTATVTPAGSPKPFTVTATDAAGTSATVSRPYNVRYAGAGSTCLGGPGHTILQPINADGTSVFKQGSTVPAKFRVCDGNGQPISSDGVVTSFRLIQVTTPLSLLQINEPVYSATPDTEFRWSATDQQWIFNIGTKNLKANNKYLYRITLNDGTTIDFSFALK